MNKDKENSIGKNSNVDNKNDENKNDENKNDENKKGGAAKNKKNKKKIKLEEKNTEENDNLEEEKNILSWWFFSEKRIGNLYFLFFLMFSLFLGAFLYKDMLEKYLTYSYDTLSYVKSDFPDYVKINENISEAKSGFLITKYLFKPVSFLPNKSVWDVEKLIIWGQFLTSWFDKMSRIGFDAILLLEQKGIGEILFSHFLDNSKKGFSSAMWELEQAFSYYENIWELWEEDLDKKLNLLKDTISTLVEKWRYLEENYDTLLDILWHSERKKYMLVFQNSDEIRPQGWFMGSVAFLEIFGGQIQSFEKKDIYALEWEANKDPFREEAPEWIDRLTETFGLRDANYFIGTEASSLKIKEILARANIEIDGVIYANINLANDLLDTLGGFDSEVLETTVNGDNFSLIMSSLVESKQSREATLDSPKDILFEFIDELILKLKEEKDYKLYSKVFIDAIESRDLFMYSFNSESASFLNAIKGDGWIDFNQTLDFNYPVFTSISWNKSDRYIERTYSKYVNTIDNCTFNTRLNVKIRHNFWLAEERDAIDVFNKYDINIEENLFIQGLWPNKQFVRIVIPKAAVINNKNVIVKEYDTIKVVEFYIDTPRFESSYFVLSYTLDNPDCEEYNYVFYKQPWISNYNFDFVLWNENLKFTWIRQDFEYKLD